MKINSSLINRYTNLQIGTTYHIARAVTGIDEMLVVFNLKSNVSARLYTTEECSTYVNSTISKQ
jgi:hypothetical protein